LLDFFIVYCNNNNNNNNNNKKKQTKKKKHLFGYDVNLLAKPENIFMDFLE